MVSLRMWVVGPEKVFPKYPENKKEFLNTCEQKMFKITRPFYRYNNIYKLKGIGP